MKSHRTNPKEGVDQGPGRFGRGIWHDFLLCLEELLVREVEKKQQAHS